MQKNKVKEQTYFEEDNEEEKVEKEEIILKKKPDTHYLAMKLPKKLHGVRIQLIMNICIKKNLIYVVYIIDLN